MGISIVTNLNHQFTEIPSRRVVVSAGQFTNMTCVYQGMEADYQAWNPRRGSAHPDFPSMFLQSDNRQDRGGGLIEVSLVYVGTILQQQNYTDLLLVLDLLQQSFSWSGPAFYTGLAVIFTFDVQYSTISCTLNYTSYKYQTGPNFESLASGFLQTLDVFGNLSDAPLQPGYVYRGLPTIPSTISPRTTLTRFNCQQQTPSQKTTQGAPDVVNTPGIWRCTETWAKVFNHGSLGFFEPNLGS